MNNLLDQCALVCFSKDSVTLWAIVTLLPDLVADVAHRVAVHLVTLA